jgi:uncharacterized protein
MAHTRRENQEVVLPRPKVLDKGQATVCREVAAVQHPCMNVRVHAQRLRERFPIFPGDTTVTLDICPKNNHSMVDFQPHRGQVSLMFERAAGASVRTALADTPVVFVAGARQSGKSTLVKKISPDRRYLTLDDDAVLAAALRDPAGFVAGLDGDVALDEVQRAPGLFPAIKASVDRNRAPGRFLMTGSANVLLVPRVAESLAGRMEIVNLWPLSVREMTAASGSMVDALLGANLPKHLPPDPAWKERVLAGGFPEIQQRPHPSRRSAWFRSYVSAVLQRDVRDLANIEGLTALPQLLSLLAARAGGLLNYADVSRSAAIPTTTLKRYLALLEMVFLFQPLPPWFANLGKRLVKSSKIYLCDSGLLAHLAGRGVGAAADPSGFGPLLENFVVMEVRKQAAVAQTHVECFHFRAHDGTEVDLVIEDSQGRLLAIEVKSSCSLEPSDLQGIDRFRAMTGPRFHRGVVLYAGNEVVPFGPRLHAVPIGSLWAPIAG